MDNLLTDITAINSGAESNAGTALDLSAGFQSPNSGISLIAPTGNSVLDGISAMSKLAVNTLSQGLGAYSSYLEAHAVANAANRLNTTPSAITGSLPTVPTNAPTPAQAMTQNAVLYAALAAGAAVIVLLAVRKRRRG